MQVNHLLEVIEVLDVQIPEVSAKIKGLVRENEDAMLLTTVPGVTYYMAKGCGRNRCHKFVENYLTTG